MANVTLDPDKMDQLKKRFDTFRAEQARQPSGDGASASSTKEQRLQQLKEATQAQRDRDRSRDR